MANGGGWTTVLKHHAAMWALALPSRRLRSLFVRRVLRWQTGSDVFIGRGMTLRNLRDLTVGDRVVIRAGAELDLRGGITIGNDVAIAENCLILTADHDPDSPSRAYRTRSVTIGNRVWLATNVTLLPGTTVSDGCVLAAGAVAHGHLEPDTIYGGNPAIAIRPRDPGAQTRLDAWLPPLG